MSAREKFRFLVGNRYYGRVSDIISGPGKTALFGNVTFGLKYDGSSDGDEKQEGKPYFIGSSSDKNVRIDTSRPADVL